MPQQNTHKDTLYQKMTDRLTNMSTDEVIEYVFRDTISHCKNERFLTKFLHHPLAAPSSALLMFDICNFQLIDRKYGTRFGQKVLAAISNVIDDNFDDSCDVVRYYGDVFVVLMYNVTSDSVLYHISNVLSDLAAMEFPEHPSIVVRAVAGGFITDELSLEALNSADIMLQKAKKNKLKGLVEQETSSWRKEFSLDELNHY